LTGAGICIFRQNGNGESINSSSPIVITRISKIECKLGNEILSVRVFAPGVYYLDDLPEEAKIPGVTLKISDQLNRSETLKVDYFSGYGMPDEGKDDFDFTFVFEHKWDVNDPHRIKYCKNPRFSSNYRYAYEKNKTVGAGLQFYKKSYAIDGIAIFSGEFGLIGPNIAFTHAGQKVGKAQNAIGGGIFYAIPQNSCGISVETFFGIKERGFGDLNKSEEQAEEYNKIIDKYFPNTNLKNKFINTPSVPSSCRQFIARVYTKPIFGIVPAFIFNGVWATESYRLREYTVAFTKKIFDLCTITASAGITYDDPHKGANLMSPDRRLTIACTIPIGTEFETSGTYTHYDDERLRSYAKMQYNPSAVKGLEITVEEYFKPEFRNPSASVKYDGEYCNIKAEETIKNIYDKEKPVHSNQQRLFFGTSLSSSGMKAYRNSNFNVLRTAKDSKK
jgi:outer membrane usher protein FimD/PapC